MICLRDILQRVKIEKRAFITNRVGAMFVGPPVRTRYFVSLQQLEKLLLPCENAPKDINYASDELTCETITFVTQLSAHLFLHVVPQKHLTALISQLQDITRNVEMLCKCLN